MLFLRFTPDRRAEVMESSTGGCNGRVCRNIYPLSSLLARGYRPVRFRALENAPAADAREAGSLAQQIKGGQTDSDAKDRSSRQPANERAARHHKKHSARN
jgi:hypothetical protein